MHYKKVVATLYDAEGNQVKSYHKYYGDDILGLGKTEDEARLIVSNAVRSGLAANKTVVKVMLEKVTETITDAVLNESNSLYVAQQLKDSVKEEVKVASVDKTQEVEALLERMGMNTKSPTSPTSPTFPPDYQV